MRRTNGIALALGAAGLDVDVFAPGGPPVDYLARQPFGRIPAFEHDGLRLFESGAISRYVDEAFSGPALQPSDAKGRARLNQITHPRIFTYTENWFSSQEHPGGPDFAVEDAALIIESGGRDHFDRLVVCWCRPEQQVERLLARGLSREDAQRRMDAQMPIDEKRRLADFGLREFGVGTLERDFGELPTEHAVGFVVERAGGRGVFVERFAHADFLGALTGEEECE